MKLHRVCASLVLTLLAGCDSDPTPRTVARTLDGIELTPIAATVPAGRTGRFSATGVFSDGARENLASGVSWSSSNEAIASVDGAGLATGRSAGVATIRATVDRVTGGAALTVGPPVLESLRVSPTPATAIIGTTRQFSAEAVYSDGTRQSPATGVTWSSSFEPAATVDGTGLVTARALGETTVRAVIGEIQGDAQLTVVPPGFRVEISAGRILVGNDLFERSWTRSPFRTERFVDLRSGRVWSENSADFALSLDGVEISADRFEAASEPVVANTPKGAVRITLNLNPVGLSALPAGFSITRVIEVYPDVAGLRFETWLNSSAPLVLAAYSLDEARPAPKGAGDSLGAEMHAFRAGADWREPEWTGPPLSLGDAQTGSWRKSTAGAAVTGTAQWLSVKDAQDRRLFYVMERNDHSSSTMSFAGGRAQARVDLWRDVIYLGPLEESGHIGNPVAGPGRHRVVVPGTPLRLEPVFTGVGLNADDEPWQHYKYLAGYRMPPYRREITFNTNNVDANRISTGAKDDMDFAEFQKQLAVARQIGIETFIFDDGWQARSGDWCPDSVSEDPACADPRRASDPVKFAPRFPDSSFSAVRAQLQPSGMKLGLWMTPLHFHPSAVAFQNNPQWACMPLSAGLLALHQADPDGGSNEAGIIQWNPEALGADGTRNIEYIESRIRRSIDDWGVRYFKFDFTVWLDCAGVLPVDLYTYRESFMAMLDRVLTDHPDVTLQMDETNDYRLFPFEAIARGPTWYQNGSPETRESLHANFLLTPFIPPYALGRAALRTGDLATVPADYQMAVALLSHLTFFNNLAQIPAAAIPVIRKWMDYYTAHRQDLAGFTYPLTADDPVAGDVWSAFQVWNPDQGRGALLVYRQNAPETSRKIALRNVPPGNYRLHQAPEETIFVDYTAAQLKAGITISLPAAHTARVYRIERRP